MGASSSTEHGSSSQDQQQEESLAASTGSLPTLRTAFSKLTNPNSSTIPLSSLQEAFSLKVANFASESPPVPEHFPELMLNLGPSIASLLFTAVDGTVRVDWVGFLKGFNRCCARMPVSSSLNLLYKIYATTCEKAGIPCNLEFDSDADDAKVGGSFGSGELLMLLWMCWVMEQGSWVSKMCKGEKDAVVLPNVIHLMLSAFVSCGAVQDDEKVWHCEVLGVDKSVSAQKLQSWVLTTAPGLANCLSKYVQEKLQACSASEHTETHYALHTKSWVGTGTIRSSIHGKGLSRFWSNIEGYNGSLMILLSANSADASEGDSSTGRWVIGILTSQGFENKDTFFGSSGHIYAISPIFRVFSPSGKEKNFIYCHLHPTVRVYEPNPKPVGLAFGGSVGNERIFMDEDFARVTLRHHAGFLPVEAVVLEVEVWGFAGRTAKERQDAYKKRETLFNEQRRKVDLKTFGSWEDSPEKMMMDMISDPNQIKRARRQEAKARKVQKDLQVEIRQLQEKVAKVKYLAEEKVVEIGSLQGALRKEEFISARLKAALALEEERKKEAENKITELEARMAGSISEVMTRAMEEFKASFEMRNLNVKFGQEMFIKGFELYEGRITRRFSELDLRFLEKKDDIEAGPFDAAVDPSFAKLASGPFEPTAEAPKPVRASEAAESPPAPPSATPPEVEILE
ncbi:hypothetical protein COCNU_09G001910 [Cocos nucifera]|uniref:TLDc domain-containing protein n=1 Tax=Cocos nucifera TaxID=13894 RepID=A0A8K0IJA1_COCNU|nr:hypothetical protein COCNU_09G001910 [Cocos nucifera]